MQDRIGAWGVRLAAFAALILALAPVQAQERGAAHLGQEAAQRLCADCHAVQRGQVRSPSSSAPAFATIAAVPGMTQAALRVALQTSHRTMPNVMLPPDELGDITAYILTLRPGG